MKLYCRACGIELTRELFELTDRKRLRHEPEADFIPQGHFMYREADVTTENTSTEGTPAARWIVINRRDLLHARPHSDPERLTGCCKLDGCAGINTCCANGHEIGVESSDCWMPHEFAFDETRVRERRVLNYAVSAYKLDMGPRWGDFLRGLQLCDGDELPERILSGDFELNGMVWNDAERTVTRRDIRNGSILHFDSGLI